MARSRHHPAIGRHRRRSWLARRRKRDAHRRRRQRRARQAREFPRPFAVVVHTCDRYRHLWPGWWHYFRQHWDWRLQPVYFANEEAAVDFAGVEQCPTGAGEWSDRLRRTLRQIGARTVFYTQEDIWLTRQIDLAAARQLYDEHELDALRVIEFDAVRPRCYYSLDHDDVIEAGGGEHALRFARRSRCLVTHRPSFWQTRFLLSTLRPGWSPWQHERLGTRMLKRQRPRPRIYALNRQWYAHVCERGRLTARGQQMAKAVR